MYECGCTQALQAAGTGLLLNERLVNAPPQVAPPLMQALFDEISWAVEDEPTKVGAVRSNANGLLSAPECILRATEHARLPQLKGLYRVRHNAPERFAQERQDSFRFTQYLLIASAYRDPQAPSEEPAQKPAKQPKKRPKVRLVWHDSAPCHSCAFHLAKSD